MIVRTLAVLGLVSALCNAAEAQTRIKVGSTRSTVLGAVLTAKERGYFKDAGLEVDVEIIDASAGFVPSLATNQLQVVEGGVSANLFNGIQQGLPIKIAIDTTSTPIGHNLMVRYDLKDEVKKVTDLKGRVVGLNAPNSIAAYEVTKVLETAGLDWKDIETKVIPFPQMAVAFSTKAIDAGLLITPYTAQLPAQNLAVRWVSIDEAVKEAMSISVSMFNTDWAKKEPDTAQKFYTAMLRGAHDYCNAYHGGSWRPELLRILVANGVAPNVELLDAITWPSRNPDGRIGKEFLLDVQRWYVKQGLARSELSLDQLVESSLAENANKAVGPFKLENTASSKSGCGKDAAVR